MKKHKHAGVVFMVLVLVSVFSAWAIAGDLEPPAGPAATMYSLDDIHTLLEEMNTQVDEIYNTYSKTPDEVCAGTAFIGFREDGTIGEMTGTKGDCNEATDP